MNRFDRASVMERAWDIHKVDRVEMSSALRKAWDEAHNAKYSYQMTDERREAIEKVANRVEIGLKEKFNIHEAHKVIILRAALRIKVVNGVAMMFGQQVGLCKWALRNA